MVDKFIIIAVTLPHFFPEEGDIISRLLRKREVDFVHIRKPGATDGQTEDLIKKIDKDFHPKLKLHDNFQLLEKYNLGGVHLNKRNPDAASVPSSISKSMHTIEELKNFLLYDYVFLSPIFDSISKPGYTSAFSFPVLSENVKGKNVIALGGVTPEKIPLLKSIGFSGAAMSGYFFIKNKSIKI